MKKNHWICSKKNSEGVLVIEAFIVIVICLYVIMFTFDFGMLFHNRIVTVAAANEAASGAASTYNGAGRDPFVGYVSPDFFDKRELYRYLSTNYNLNENTEKKAKWYGSYLIYSQEYSIQHRESFNQDVQTICEHNSQMGCQTVSVNISRKYSTFFINPLSIFGIEPEYTCSATGTAVCYDPLYQMNMMGLVDQAASKVDSLTLTGDIINNCWSIMKTLFTMF